MGGDFAFGNNKEDDADKPVGLAYQMPFTDEQKKN